jgi:Nif-specific regulatory protein
MPSSTRAAHHLGILLSIATRIGAIHDEVSLLWQLLGMMFEVVPAERGAILLAGKGTEFMSAAAWNRTGTTLENVPVIRTVLRQACEERSGVLVHSVVHTVAGDESIRDAESALLSQAHSVLCVPMAAGKRVLGMIYLDVVNPSIEFSDNDLQVAMGIASIASLALENVRNTATLRIENDRLRQDLDLQHNLLGDSVEMCGLRQMITRMAAADTTVLICGESGTGKELVARAIHDSSDRSDGLFVAINCAALTETLLESELFGHEKGAFTGAVAQKRGQIEVATGGTLFLDEVGELAGGLQAKLLRALQEREIVRVGGTRPIKVDVRVLAATNRDLAAGVAAGSFRQDLFYRLNVVRVDVPPLRAHRNDIAALAEHFLERYSNKCKRRVHAISPLALQALMAYDWPGNVRELQNAIERAVVLGSSDVILPEDLPEALWETAAGPPTVAPESYHDALLAFKKQLILNAIAKSDGTLAQAARLLGLHPNYLHRLVTNLDLRSALRKTG